MKVLGISGSPRDKNTSYMLKTVLNATGQDTELILLKDLDIKPCKACTYCRKNHCCTTGDDMQKLYPKIKEADILIFGSPTYMSNVSGIMKNFMDRFLPFYLSKEIDGKRVAFLAVGNFKEDLEFDADGNCLWHKEEEESVAGCIQAFRAFGNIFSFKEIGEVHALHGDSKSEDKELISLGNKIGKL
ncbi:MAG: NADPH-dependent FMN reductase [candidate division CPR2 bacterium GW2011_GWC1_39_9]|uniref:NADPH-dependent FMN reductase n=1 Tax=candidate division CPR2 bacterium GW2011_GWC2_39_10 TaxID=1618345 RepID=A0A0G0M483_UNCC2|nr:MAG: NADPH-dependent FMN reductase [candidate division CPR2 bacterium GW2011_GWC2_39_10]KKR28225.1 MAG: NADPH-dependent FMN reductase [candidate division CPR2 bacterium GW2011_GWD1_39_7]KKR35966.1 MAG: NADPH-dependent FMN reductase [candidate division CPR2 bacterium GW2011_GWC1_39_9]OGB60424.1 MAG: hypothetical protein A2Y27_00230 [candidate division CPR2 bacterium GWD1_39_7]